MEQSGQGSQMENLIINSPSMQSLWQRYSSFILTFIFWVIWFFLWVPVATLLAWYFGYHLVYFEMFTLEGYKEVIQDFISFLVIVAIMGGSLAIWATYNFMRFKGKDRRSKPQTITLQDQAEFFGVDSSLLQIYQKKDFVSVSFDEKGNIVDLN